MFQLGFMKLLSRAVLGVLVFKLQMGCLLAGMAQVEFGVYWPPDSASKPLLRGTVSVQATNMVARVSVTLARPQDEASREFWNSRLAFPEHAWMKQVRVWDAKHQWLWPNLPYLLRLHGVERVERYGGVDPEKGVDNDFAAVLLRKYDASGETESMETKRMPLVSAEWHPVGISGEVNKETIVHATRSDEFTLYLRGDGRIGIWLIYGDFLGAKPPKDWPKKPEYNGGILTYFQADWRRGGEIKLRQTTPPCATGFDWCPWAAQARQFDGVESPSRLTDLDSK